MRVADRSAEVCVAPARVALERVLHNEHPYERPEMASVFTTYREVAHLGPPGVFSALLTVFALPSVFLASGLSLILLTWFTRYIPKRY